ncbi:D-isomer specific 2-hydroxyacid dehydrogenase [Hypoxylon trugodes]|uniref:D-isomer specific 2-hydroxyacid dehydrogenase n=1 Tax=Hypoxylon trugodes TaxID=326681 RepID=UPI00219DDEB7|nr:D-isomer specific 2-hydroxyacid dehydrogenase [Hypoxylon trugodes]KAI1386783.1 D-isomer specific 2-hydroxyacid dehydrogenase [Hypoxylon trugodes]
MASSSSNTHLIIAALESKIVPVPDFDLPAPYTYELRRHLLTPPETIAERIKDADIVIMSVVPLRGKFLDPAVSPRLKLIVVVAVGTDTIDLEACKKRGIAVANSPLCNSVAVAEHAIALYFAVRRSVVFSQKKLRSAAEFTTNDTLLKAMKGPDGNAPRTCRHETVGIVGYGGVGRIVESLAKALGMKVLVSGRKGASATAEGRTSFETLIRESSVIVLCLPRSPETMDLISKAELEAMKPYAVIVNVSRGGIVNEKALVAALKTRKIGGYATDVYEQEPPSLETSTLLAPDTADLNLVTTPHVAWFAEETFTNFADAIKENVVGWVSTGRPKYPVI